MSTKSRPPDIAIEVLWVKPEAIHPNAYNPNVLDGDLYQKAIASIRKHGFVDPLTVRYESGGTFEVIDGEHRLKAAIELELNLVPVIVLDVDDDEAQELTLILNELHGRPDAARLRRVLQGLAERHPVEQLLTTLPFAREQFIAITAPSPFAPPTPGVEAMRWVERMYRLPRGAADVLDAALERAKQFEEITDDWRALEALAKAYLEGD